MSAHETLPANSWRPLLPEGVALAVGLVLIGVLFAAEGKAAVEVWRQSTAYGHCWLVLPIALWLLWERRGVLSRVAPAPAPWPVLLALPIAGIWIVSDWLGVMEGRQLAAIAFVLLLLLAVLGPRLWWALSPGFLYLVFLVPFGAFLTPALQRFTTSFVVGGLDFLRIPYDADSFRIAIPEGVFYVAEACAGLRFLIASIAFGVLYALTMFRSPGRRVVFIVVACLMPVVANGMRGLGIVVLGHALGSAEAASADHLIYGWVFFSLVILLLAICGLPFREDLAPVAASDRGLPVSGQALRRRAPSSKVWLAAVPVLLTAAAGPVFVAGSSHRTGGVVSMWRPVLTAPGGCQALPAKLNGNVAQQSFTCPDGGLSVTTTVLQIGTNPALVLDAARDPGFASLGGDVDSERLHVIGATPADWMLLSDRENGRVAAYVLWIDGEAALGGMQDRLHMARDMLDGGNSPPIAVVVDAPNLATLKAFLVAQEHFVPGRRAEFETPGGTRPSSTMPSSEANPTVPR